METFESIVLSFDNHVKTTNTQYSDWCIGPMAEHQASVLAGRKSINLECAVDCAIFTAQDVVDHFVEKGMKRDSRISSNAGLGVFIYRDR